MIGRVLGALLLLTALPAAAQVNQTRGGIAGFNNSTLTGGDGSGQAQLTLTPVTLALVKQARDTGGVVLADGSDVVRGQTIFFVLYVDNTTGFPANDIRITDAINETQFTYVAGSLARRAVPSGSSDAVIWSGAWTTLTDGVGAPDDTGSVTNTGGPAGADRVTIGAVAGQANQAVSIPASTLQAYRFSVTVN